MAAVTFASGAKMTIPTSPNSIPGPTAALTYSPSANPSESPTTAAFSPSQSPTIASVTLTTFSQLVRGISKNDSSTQKFKLAFQRSIATSVNINISDILIQSITSVGQSQSSVEVIFTISINNNRVSPAELTSALNDAISKGTITNSVRVSGYTTAAADTAVVAPTSAPTTNSKASSKLSYGDRNTIIASTIGSFYFLLCL
jgi:hypothetical protein